MIMKGDYFFLSNFYPCTIGAVINNNELFFNSVEAAFQAHKNIEMAEHFLLMKPLEAKKAGAKVKLTTENWDITRLYVMGYLLCTKFSNIVLYNKLKNVSEEIAEDNYWGDTFWGVCKGEGKNVLGKLLMQIRDNGPDKEKMKNYIDNELIPSL